MDTTLQAEPQAVRAMPLLLALSGAANMLIYVAALWRFPLLTLYTRLRFNLPDFVGNDLLVGTVLTAALLALFMNYALGLVALRGTSSRAATALVWLVPLGFCALLLFTQPATSIDIYDYLFRAHMADQYGVNIFVTPPNQFTNDPLFQHVAWRNAVTAYGPIWERFGVVMTWLVGNPPTSNELLLRLMFAYKALALVGLLLGALAIWNILRERAPQQRTLGVYLWLWNPLVLWETIAAGHNDTWVAAPTLLALWAFGVVWANRDEQQRFVRSQIAFLLLTIGGLIKYLTLFFFGPAVLVAAVRRQRGVANRVWLVVIGALLCGGLIVLLYAPYWVGTDTLRNFNERGALFYASWIAMVRPLLITPFGDESAKQIASLFGLGLLGLGVLWSMWRSWRAPAQVIEHLAWLLVWFLFVCNPWFQPWYVLWLVALVALLPDHSRLVWCTLVFSATAALSYPAAAFLRPLVNWPVNSSEWNALLSLLIYLPPLIVLLWPDSKAKNATSENVVRSA